MKIERSNKLLLDVKWHGYAEIDGTGRVRSEVIGGMQIEFWRRDPLQIKYGFSQKWEYRLLSLKGDICWGLAHTKTGIKQVAVEALKKRLFGFT